jgi:sacsin
VRQLSLAEFYTNHVLPRLSQLPAAVQKRAVLHMLLELPRLSSQDTGFQQALQNVQVVPSFGAEGGGSGDGGGTELKRVGELYDPEVPELRALLGAHCFPSAEFRTPSALVALRSLGLRTSLSKKGVLDSAMSVQDLSRTDEAAAVARARRLLKFVDMHSQTLLGGGRINRGNGGGGQGAQAQRSMGPEYYDSSDDDEGFGSPDELDDVDEAECAEDEGVDLRTALLEIAWLPVCKEPPVTHLPWKGTQQQMSGIGGSGVGANGAPTMDVRLAVSAPARTRPQADMWLCSALLDILDESQGVQVCNEYT